MQRYWPCVQNEAKRAVQDVGNSPFSARLLSHLVKSNTPAAGLLCAHHCYRPLYFTFRTTKPRNLAGSDTPEACGRRALCDGVGRLQDVVGKLAEGWPGGCCFEQC